jgi:hypothetical protein
MVTADEKKALKGWLRGQCDQKRLGKRIQIT